MHKNEVVLTTGVLITNDETLYGHLSIANLDMDKPCNVRAQLIDWNTPGNPKVVCDETFNVSPNGFAAFNCQPFFHYEIRIKKDNLNCIVNAFAVTQGVTPVTGFTFLESSLIKVNVPLIEDDDDFEDEE